MTVVPVVDYEPVVPAADAGPPRPQKRTGRRRLRPAPDPPAARSGRLRAAASFADAALRGVLEVIDHRRLPTQLRPMLAAGLIDSVGAFARAAPARRSAAVLRRVRLQPTDDDERAFEVSAGYTRGRRTHAIACRIECVDTARGETWQVVALHIG